MWMNMSDERNALLGLIERQRAQQTAIRMLKSDVDAIVETMIGFEPYFFEFFMDRRLAAREIPQGTFSDPSPLATFDPDPPGTFTDPEPPEDG
jgi:hypothetical protein